MRWIILFIVFILSINSTAQLSEQLVQDSLNKKRLTTVIATEATLYSGIMIGLNSLWYKDYPRSSFHFFNDNDEWRGIDKVGHAMTGYYVGLLGMDALRWAGVDEKKSRWYGGGLGWFFLTSFEVLDGTSEAWGFSPGDLAANTIGAGMVIGQDALWHQQRIVFKFSTHQTEYAQLRPEVLGSNWRERVMKDYNGQTYWLSGNLASFVKEESRMPKWLNMAVGYSIENQIHARDEPVAIDQVLAYRTLGRSQYFLSLDADLWRIPTKKKWLKTVLKGVGFLKIPAPTLEVGSGGTKFYWLYF